MELEDNEVKSELRTHLLELKVHKTIGSKTFDRSAVAQW